jgi:hypothetical protein
MICDIIERVNIKKVDKCLASDLHIDPAYVVLHPNTERLLCHIWHIKGPKYNNVFYAMDMIWDTVKHPSRAKSLWAEMQYTLKRGKEINNG